ncbi:MAG TPA: prepilin-type N-terminal cleavage/methylation domain-containing protein [Moraxellaceae bacterium]|nr:prepilin-type N-terminal cleavage/methylation domain-containing protein [Moraxellaceae bacterium]
MRQDRGFTLIELLVVMAVVAMLLSIVAPRYMSQADRAREAVLRENLSGLRAAIDQYQADKGGYPATLQELVDKRYLRKMPLDPITNKTTTWEVVTTDEDGKPVVYDVKSGAPGAGLDGSAYKSW